MTKKIVLTSKILDAINSTLENYTVITHKNQFYLIEKHDFDPSEITTVLSGQKFNSDSEVYWTTKLSDMLEYVMELV